MNNEKFKLERGLEETMMIAFEVTLNGERVCVAGANDLSVLTTIVSASGKLGTKTVPPKPNDGTRYIEYSVGGLTSRPNPKEMSTSNGSLSLRSKLGT